MIDAGDTAWLITATALVLFMTLPGLALFYGGLVRAENLLSVLMQCFAIACLVSVAWLAGAYSLAFNGAGAWIGNLDKALLLGLPRDAVAPNTTLPETVFFMFQMTFAIITPGADRRRLRRTHALRRRAAVQPALAAAGLRAGGPLGVGRRLARPTGRARFRRRAGGASRRRESRRWCLPSCSARASAFPTMSSRRMRRG